MTLSYLLCKVPEDDLDLYEIIPIAFNMLDILKDMYYYLHMPEKIKYIIQTRSATQASGVWLQETYGIDSDKSSKYITSVTYSYKGQRINLWSIQGRYQKQEKNQQIPYALMVSKKAEQPKLLSSYKNNHTNSWKTNKATK